jgi:hypothetical protein
MRGFNIGWRTGTVGLGVAKEGEARVVEDMMEVGTGISDAQCQSQS